MYSDRTDDLSRNAAWRRSQLSRVHPELLVLVGRLFLIIERHSVYKDYVCGELERIIVVLFSSNTHSLVMTAIIDRVRYNQLPSLEEANISYQVCT